MPLRRTRSTLAASAAALVTSVFAAPASADVFTNVPEAAGYNLVYTLPVPLVGGLNGATVPYTVNNAAAVPRGSFDRIAYYMEVQVGAGPVQYVYASMNSFTDDARRIGVPHQSGGFFQQPVGNVNVASNVAGVPTGTALNGFNVEFWRTNYAQVNSAAVPNASAATFDTGDQPTAGGYGGMQLHNNAANQPVFAYNRWGTAQGNVDIGIGASAVAGSNPDYTFRQNAGDYSVRNIQVLVRPSALTQSHKLQIMPLGDSITEGAGATGGYRTQLQTKLAAAGIDFEFVGSNVTNPSGTLGLTGRVTHEGHGGYRIDQISSGLDSAGSGGSDNNGFWFNPTIQPDVVLLHIGTNDFGQNFSTATAKDRLDALIGKITAQRPNARVIVTNLLERTDNAAANANINTQFNPFVQGIVNSHAALGERVTFLDMDSVINPLTDLGDGLHPNQTGYNKMGDAWFGAINAVVPEPTGAALAGTFAAAGLLRRRARRLA